MSWFSETFLGKKPEKIDDSALNALLSDPKQMQQDIQQNMGTALNQLSGRGVINSSITPMAFGQAYNMANQNRMNALLQKYGIDMSNRDMGSPGILGGMISDTFSGLGTLGGLALGGWAGGLGGSKAKAL